MSSNYQKTKEKEPIKRTPNEEVELLAKKEEPRFLSILLKYKDKLQDAIAFGIVSDHFRFKENAYLYRIIVKNYETNNGSLLTKNAMDSIMDQQSQYTEEQKSARKMQWHKVYGLENSSEDYDRLKKNINSRYLQDQLYTIISSKTPEIVGSIAGQDELVRQIQQEINALKNVDANSFDLIVPSNIGIKQAITYIEERKDHPERHKGIMCGIRGIDNEFYGFDRGSYTVISGMTNGGKTTLMFNMGWNMSILGHSVVYVSLEKKALPLWVRLVCLHAMVDYNRIKKGGNEEWGISPLVWTKLTEAKNDLENKLPNFDIVQLSQGDTLTKIFSKIEEIRAVKNVDVVILDYLGCVGTETKTVGRHDIDQANVSRRFQAYCKRHNYVAITGLQIKAAATKEIRKKTENIGESDDIQKIAIQSEDLAGSQEVIRDADNGIGVVLSAEQPPTKIYVHSTKSRDNQGHRTIELDFDGRIGRIADPDLEIGEIRAIDEIIYNNNLSLQDMVSDEKDLFSKVDEQKEEPKQEPKEEAIKAFQVEPEDMIVEDTKVISPVEEVKPKSGKNIVECKSFDDGLDDLTI